MKQLKIAFDVDDTLIIPSVAGYAKDIPNYDTIGVFKWFQAQGHEMIIWSGSGVDWASKWAEKLGLKATILRKGEITVDLAFDDCDVVLGAVNIKVKRVNNNVDRTEWNKIKR